MMVNALRAIFNRVEATPPAGRSLRELERCRKPLFKRLLQA
jgi:hypothetical protein